MKYRPALAHLILAAVLLLGLALRLHGIHDPLLDHPGWRQGDTAAIARNFATLDLNPFHPQTDYDGPPPNYVELELQILPFLAALLYKLFGIHEIFGRLISIAFSLCGVGLLYYFAGWLFGERGQRNEPAGIAAAFAYAVYPGSLYYGRTFTPDATMATFAIAAAYAGARRFAEGARGIDRGLVLAGGLAALAILAKPVAVIVLVPVLAVALARGGWGAIARPAVWLYLALALVPYAAYDAYVRGIAEWHWSSGILAKHVLPELGAAFASPHAFVAKLALFRGALAMLAQTMLGAVGSVLALVSLAVPAQRRSRALLWSWLAAALLYAFVVVTVERVDYYLFLILPLAALWTGGLVARLWTTAAQRAPLRTVAAVLALALAVGAVWNGRAAVRPYYVFRADVFGSAKALDATLAPDALVVMGHYDPSVLYYIGRKGWEEDPYLWTPFDEESAIRKGARYFIAVEPARLRRNVELCHWLQRFPVRNANAAWPVYETDPAKVLPGAEERWRAFRRVEATGGAAPCTT